MIPPWAYLDEHDRSAFRATTAFLNKRLTEQDTIDWALKLNPAQRIERIAVLDLLNQPRNEILSDPWAAAWRLIEEYWSSPTIEEGPSTTIYDIQSRLHAGDRSGSVVSAIVNLVAPRLKLQPIGSWRWQVVKKPRRPKAFDHLLSASLTSGDLIDLKVLKLAELTDVTFLNALAVALEAAINHGLEIARRLGWEGRLWRLGGVGRVYYVTSDPAAGDTEDPDEHIHGISPSVKLLHAVVTRIIELDIKAALPFVQRWRFVNSPVHIRLWAAAARDPQLVGAQEVGIFLSGLDDRRFWDLTEFPEITELRALRFADLDPGTQKAIAKRLRKGPPRDHWPKKADPAKVKNARLYTAVREFKRIDVAGNLPPAERTWMETNISQFDDLATMAVDDGLPKSSEAEDIPRSSGVTTYDTLDGVTRLRAMDAALSTDQGLWEGPGEQANAWLSIPEKADVVLADLESTDNGGDDFAQVWNRFGWANQPKQPSEASQRQVEADRVLALLRVLSEKTLSVAIEGISHWLDVWKKEVVASPVGPSVWQRVWPIAVEATNIAKREEDVADLCVSVADDHREPMDLDTLNTPTGKLVGVFLAASFAGASIANQMRDTVIGATGRSRLIAQHRLIEFLPHFLSADGGWTQEHLIMPLLNDDSASLALWRAIARRTRFTEVLKIIGGPMTARAADRRLGRETRQSLAFSLVVESLHAFRENRQPAIPNPRIQQMLRSLDDEVRAAAANAIQQFVREMSQKQSAPEKTASAAELFQLAAGPFLRKVWPQERSLATPGVSAALADLPATSGEAFVEAVEAIDRFLVPFECWSMLNYGVYGQEGEAKKLTIINNEAKGKALLLLLNLTVGSSEGAVIPHDLTDALDQIRSVAPTLVDDPAFRRLSTAARR